MGVLGTTHLLPFRSSQSLPDCSACGPAPTKRNGTKRRHVSDATSFCPKPVWVTKLGSFIRAGIVLVTSDIATATPPRAARKALTADAVSRRERAHASQAHGGHVADTWWPRGGHVAERFAYRAPRVSRLRSLPSASGRARQPPQPCICTRHISQQPTHATRATRSHVSHTSHTQGTQASRTIALSGQLAAVAVARMSTHPAVSAGVSTPAPPAAPSSPAACPSRASIFFSIIIFIISENASSLLRLPFACGREGREGEVKQAVREADGAERRE